MRHTVAALARHARILVRRPYVAVGVRSFRAAVAFYNQVTLFHILSQFIRSSLMLITQRTVGVVGRTAALVTAQRVDAMAAAVTCIQPLGTFVYICNNILFLNSSLSIKKNNN